MGSIASKFTRVSRFSGRLKDKLRLKRPKQVPEDSSSTPKVPSSDEERSSEDADWSDTNLLAKEETNEENEPNRSLPRRQQKALETTKEQLFSGRTTNSVVAESVDSHGWFKFFLGAVTKREALGMKFTWKGRRSTVNKIVDFYDHKEQREREVPFPRNNGNRDSYDSIQAFPDLFDEAEEDEGDSILIEGELRVHPKEDDVTF